MSVICYAGINLPQERIEKIKQELLAEFARSDENPRPEIDQSAESSSKAATTKEDTAEPASTEESESKSAQPAKQKVPGIDGLLRARRSLVGLIGEQLQTPFDVTFNGVESGDIEAVIKARWQSNQVGVWLGATCQGQHQLLLYQDWVSKISF